MKKRLSVILIIALATMALSAANADLRSVREHIDKIEEQRMQERIDGDFDKMIGYYTNDAVVMPAFQPLIKGRKQILEMFDKDRKNDVKMHSLSRTMHDDWICGEDYCERGTWAMSITTKDTVRPLAFNGSYFQIWKKQKDGSYKIKYNIWNLDHEPF
jgi:ketosteroid isomerase-like protein